MAQDFVNIAAYKFVALDNLPQRKQQLLPFCTQLGLKGTILLSEEGINLFLSGTRDSINRFVGHLRNHEEFADIPVKESPSEHQPHSRMLIRLKKEIISMGMDEIQPRQKTSPKIKPDELKNWLDKGKEVVLLDVRNDYEVELGTFVDARPIGVDSFRTFPDAVDELPEELKQKPIVMFCTGGIRCEKAGPLMEQKGFQEIYQLDGGILKYFEDCGGEHYDGDCFVFDKRVAVDPKLEETDADLCYACQAILNPEDKASDKYDPPHVCPHCYLTPLQQMKLTIEDRNERLQTLINPLPGSTPYNNVRPINVPLRFDHFSVIKLLTTMHPQLNGDYWRSECELGRILWKGEPLDLETEVRAGWRIEHLLPQTTEPDVNANLKIIYEDAEVIAIDKPAPLPMHACGRFNRNSLSYILNELYKGEQIRICHRLDANTTGVVICCRKKASTRVVQKQFKAGAIRKTYIAEVIGHVDEDVFTCEAPIASQPSTAGARVIDGGGQPAKTDFRVIQRNKETTLLECRPITGRTNQIRVHLWYLNIPIVGDPLYLADQALGKSQTLRVHESPMRLHAKQLELTHPTEDVPLVLTAELPGW